MPSPFHAVTGIRRVAAVAALVLGSCLPGLGHAARVGVAVASNFAPAAEELAAQFEARHPHEVVLSSGSTGKLYAQIRHGAPFDLFLAADVRRPRLLEQSGHAVAGSRFTYAIGQLVLWSRRTGYVDRQGAVLETRDFHHLALANPRLAPYGAAARQTLESLGLWEALQGRLVRGENVAQAHQYVASGTAALGFVALSQLRGPETQAIPGSYWLVPQSRYSPIEQQAVLLDQASAPSAARAFLTFLHSAPAHATLEAFGYRIPDR